MLPSLLMPIGVIFGWRTKRSWKYQGTSCRHMDSIHSADMKTYIVPAGSIAWNSLSVHLQEEKLSYGQFSNKVKTFLFCIFDELWLYLALMRYILWMPEHIVKCNLNLLAYLHLIMACKNNLSNNWLNLTIQLATDVRCLRVDSHCEVNKFEKMSLDILGVWTMWFQPNIHDHESWYWTIKLQCYQCTTNCWVTWGGPCSNLPWLLQC